MTEPTMTTDLPLDHEALLTLARKTEAAAHDGDRERLAGIDDRHLP